jgi:hypothetical protein
MGGRLYRRAVSLATHLVGLRSWRLSVEQAAASAAVARSPASRDALMAEV